MPLPQSRLLKGKLPDRIQTGLAFLFTIPFGCTLNKMAAPYDASLALSHPLCIFILSFLMISIFLAFASFLLPDFIHLNMTLFMFFLWTLLNVGLTLSAYKFCYIRDFTISIAIALLSLFTMVLFHYHKHIWHSLQVHTNQEKQHEIFEYGADILIAKTATIIVLVVSIVGFTVMPLIGWNAQVGNIKLVFVTTTILHTSAFFVWFVVSILASATIEKVDVP